MLNLGCVSLKSCKSMQIHVNLCKKIHARMSTWKRNMYKLQQFLLCEQHTKRSGQCHYYENKYKHYSLTKSLHASIIKFQ